MTAKWILAAALCGLAAAQNGLEGDKCLGEAITLPPCNPPLVCVKDPNSPLNMPSGYCKLPPVSTTKPESSTGTAASSTATAASSSTSASASGSPSATATGTNAALDLSASWFLALVPFLVY
ncbi:hypothetical protein HDV03_000481 [Kappamyces sp. JEL0829]|nr:hypothetical protein HDV03_000481 [Kappamyces sp. JEL0829]